MLELSCRDSGILLDCTQNQPGQKEKEKSTLRTPDQVSFCQSASPVITTGDYVNGLFSGYIQT
jgi:hypothetical protein